VARFPAGTEICLHTAAVTPVVGSMLPPTQFVQRSVSPELRRRAIRLKTHLHGTVLEHSGNFIFTSAFIPSYTLPASTRAEQSTVTVGEQADHYVHRLLYVLSESGAISGGATSVFNCGWLC